MNKTPGKDSGWLVQTVCPFLGFQKLNAKADPVWVDAHLMTTLRGMFLFLF